MKSVKKNCHYEFAFIKARKDFDKSYHRVRRKYWYSEQQKLLKLAQENNNKKDGMFIAYKLMLSAQYSKLNNLI